MNEQPEQFVPESLRRPTPQPARSIKPFNPNKRSGAILIVIGAAIFTWAFMLQPFYDAQDRLERSVDHTHYAATEVQIRHRELIATVLGSSLLLLGGILFAKDPA